MQWPDWLSSDRSNNTSRAHGSSPVDQVDTTTVVVASALSAAASLGLFRFYRAYLRRIPNVNYLSPARLRKRSIYGYVTSVGDGDNFRLFHTPGGRLAGWGWLPGRQVQKMKKFPDSTIHVRIAGIDAPEMAHFGRPAQPFSREAVEWLRSFVLRRYVRVYPYRRDQYERVVCTVYTRRWGVLKADVGLNMLQRGLATVYEAKFGSEFGNKEAEYRAAEERAKQKKLGMWEEPGIVGRILGKKSKPLESPREYKTRMTKLEAKQDLAR